MFKSDAFVFASQTTRTGTAAGDLTGESRDTGIAIMPQVMTEEVYEAPAPDSADTGVDSFGIEPRDTRVAIMPTVMVEEMDEVVCPLPAHLDAESLDWLTV